MAGKQNTVADVAADLRAPFDEAQVKTSKDGDFTYHTVKPEFYVERLNTVMPQTWEVEYGNAVPFLSKGELVSVSVTAKLTLNYGEGVKQTVGGIGAADFDDRSFANVIKSAESDALKRACAKVGLTVKREAGEASDNEEAETQSSQRSNSTQRSSRSSSDDRGGSRNERGSSRGGSRGGNSSFDRDATFGGKGKLSDVPWRKMDGSTLQWITETFDKGSKNYDFAQLEIEARGDDFDPNEGKPKGNRGGGGGRGRSGGRENRGRASNDNWD